MNEQQTNQAEKAPLIDITEPKRLELANNGAAELTTKLELILAEEQRKFATQESRLDDIRKRSLDLAGLVGGGLVVGAGLGADQIEQSFPLYLAVSALGVMFLASFFVMLPKRGGSDGPELVESRLSDRAGFRTLHQQTRDMLLVELIRGTEAGRQKNRTLATGMNWGLRVQVLASAVAIGGMVFAIGSSS